MLAAVSAWRVTEASGTGTEDASVNGPYLSAVVMDLAHQLQIAERTTVSLIRSAMDLESMTPRCWRLFVLGECGA